MAFTGSKSSKFICVGGRVLKDSVGHDILTFSNHHVTPCIFCTVFVGEREQDREFEAQPEIHSLKSFNPGNIMDYTHNRKIMIFS